MRKSQRYCDLCGEEITEKKWRYISYREAPEDTTTRKPNWQDFDLCKNHAWAFEIWIEKASKREHSLDSQHKTH